MTYKAKPGAANTRQAAEVGASNVNFQPHCITKKSPMQDSPFDPVLSRNVDLLAQIADIADLAARDAWQTARYYAGEAIRHARARDAALMMLMAAEASIVRVCCDN